MSNEIHRTRVDLILEQAVHDDLDSIMQRLTVAEKRIGDLEEALATERADRARADKAVLGRLLPMITAMRLDRQARSIVGRAIRPVRDGGLRERLSPSRAKVLVVCPAYPGGESAYGGQFVRARLLHYADLGVHVQVVVTDLPRPSQATSAVQDGITVHRVHRSELNATVRRLSPALIAVHHMEPSIWQGLKPLAGTLPMVVWVHGYEALDWRDREFNYTAEQLADQREALDAAAQARRTAVSEMFDAENLHVVFVSQYMRSLAERFAGRPARSGRVIPNVVDSSTFPYRARRAEERRNVLWARAFASPKYANDLARDAVLALAGTDEFAQMHLTVVGDGPLFEESTEPLSGFANVSIRRGYVGHDEMAGLFEQHGVMLVPTRWDSQGLTCLEAMSCGLVAVTNDVAAVPEFVPPETGILCPPEDPGALAEALLGLQRDPEDYLERSRLGAEAVRATCDVPHTVARECALITSLLPTRRRVRSARGPATRR